MNKFTKYFVVPMLCLASNFAMAANIKDYPRVAVMDFGNKAITSRGLRGHDMAMATEYAIYQLSACGWFDLIDYESLNAIAQMHKINMSGFVDQGTAVQMGKIAGAQFMVIGNVTGLTTKENIAALRANTANASNAQHVVNANVTLRIVDIETGRIVVAGIGKGSSTSTLTEIGFKKYRNRKVESERTYNSVAQNVVDELSKKSGSRANRGQSYDNYDRNYKDNENYKDNKNIESNNTRRVNERENSTYGESSYKKGSEYERGGGTENTKSNTDTYSYTPDKKDVKFVSIEGDINEDGQIDEKDFQSIEYYFMKGQKLGPFSDRNADVDGDGEITIKDAWEVRKIVDGLYHKTYKHIVGDVDSAEPYGYVTESDVKRLERYLLGYRDDYINILEADINGDGYITLTDLSQLKNLVGTWQKKIIGNMYQTLPQKYWDYNKNHGIVVSEEKGGMEKTGTTIGNKDKTSSYYKQKDMNEQSGMNGYIERNNKIDDVTDYNYNEQASGDRNRVITDSERQESGYSNQSDYSDENLNKANNKNTVQSSTKNIYYEREEENYSIVIGTVEVSDVQVRNAISKAVRDAIYGKTGIMTTLNNGKQLKIKTGF